MKVLEGGDWMSENVRGAVGRVGFGVLESW